MLLVFLIIVHFISPLTFRRFLFVRQLYCLTTNYAASCWYKVRSSQCVTGDLFHSVFRNFCRYLRACVCGKHVASVSFSVSRHFVKQTLAWKSLINAYQQNINFQAHVGRTLNQGCPTSSGWVTEMYFKCLRGARIIISFSTCWYIYLSEFVKLMMHKHTIRAGLQEI
jgi:hypothetical protein